MVLGKAKDNEENSGGGDQTKYCYGVEKKHI